ncbi:NHLM bacteriocin system secretion protein [Rhodospirillales bacterium URHD0017]|nr:NHLM bacteriocin system secretion protein [Rhodospirillales bacterium URHD0017]
MADTPPEAQKRFASPDHLDQRINLIPPAMRVMALSATVLVIAGLVWAFFGSVPTRATGRGVLLADGKASHTVQPVVSGPIIELLVTRGQQVEADALIARIEQVSLNTQLASNTARVGVMEQNLARLKAAHDIELAKSEASYRRQSAAAEEQISAGKIRATQLKEILTADEALLQRGLVSRMEVANARSQYDQTMQEVANATARAVQIESQREQKRDMLADVERQKQEDIDALKADGARLQSEVSIGSAVKAPVAGRIEEIRVGRGDVVSPGTVLVTIGQVNPGSFEILAVFANNMAKRIVPGMDTHIRPVSVKKEEHGSMRGRVLSISELSISKAELDAILRNSELTNNLMGDTAPLLAKIEVFLDKGTPSGFAWWGGQGPPFAVTRGTRVDVDVLVDHRRPIALIIPAFRQLLGLEG